MPTSANSLPAVTASDKDVGGIIERVISHVPAAKTHRVEDPDRAAEEIARAAARQAAVLSGSLALPPGPFGMVTVLPDLYLIWKTQRQMIADIFGLYGRSAELSRSTMLYCLFRHAASQVMRDFVVRTGQRIVVEQLSSGAIKHVAGKVGVSISKRVAGSAASRWVPLAGAAAVGVYAYWDTMQVAKTARRLIDNPAAQR
jgi:hypothetical protein